MPTNASLMAKKYQKTTFNVNSLVSVDAGLTTVFDKYKK